MADRETDRRSHSSTDTTSSSETTHAPESTSTSSASTIPQAAGTSASDRAFGGPQQTGGPEIDATKEAMGGHVVAGMQRANVEPGSGGQNDLNHGIHYW